MFNLIYKITSPKVVEEFVDVVDNDENSVLVKVEMMAICKADIRYFLGARDQNVLNHKYPLAPIHEAVGRVIKDPTGHFKKNDKVILVPNSVNENFCIDCPNKRCERKDLGKNYCPYAEFKSSSSDGFLCGINPGIKKTASLSQEAAFHNGIRRISCVMRSSNKSQSD